MTKKSEETEAAPTREVYEGQPPLPADDPSFAKQEWPEAYDNPLVEDKGKDKETKSETKAD